MLKNYLHKPVLLNEAIKSLNIHPDGIYLDGTFGRGGHSRLILSKLNANGHLFAMDCDPTAVEAAKNINDSRFTIIHGLISTMNFHMKKLNSIGSINGILLDLGVSSPQLEDHTRGFSFKNNGLLDMRMDTTCGQSAAQWLTRASVDDITWVLKTFGEERFAKRIAKAIFLRNQYQPITSNQELVALITNNIPFRDKHKHPAKRSFQAIRIYINNELKEIKQALNGALTLLAPKGRLSVISFHSLEDRLVKQFIREHSCHILKIPAKLPLTEQQISAHYKNNNLQLKSIGKILPSTQEITDNYRSRSAILRVAEKI